jgi:hypothetical protein
LCLAIDVCSFDDQTSEHCNITVFGRGPQGYVFLGKFFTVKDFFGIIFGYDQVGYSGLGVFSGF